MSTALLTTGTLCRVRYSQMGHVQDEFVEHAIGSVILEIQCVAGARPVLVLGQYRWLPQ